MHCTECSLLAIIIITHLYFILTLRRLQSELTVSSSLHIFTNFPVYMLLPITFPAPSGWSFSCPHGLTGILHIRIMYVHEKQKIPPLLSQEQLQCYYSEAQNTFIHLRANHITQTYFCTQTSLTVLIEP